MRRQHLYELSTTAAAGVDHGDLEGHHGEREKMGGEDERIEMKKMMTSGPNRE